MGSELGQKQHKFFRGGGDRNLIVNKLELNNRCPLSIAQYTVIESSAPRTCSALLGAIYHQEGD